MNHKKYELASNFLRNAEKMNYSEQEIKGAIRLLYEEVSSEEKVILSLYKHLKARKGADENEH
ncbi:hypothetical protein [Bacillus paralicheniformis]|uniref:hypothetical protein n=1 Tax=Bacillus paralicheniformis TaxID=1648923 RepID=UPI00224463B3|nr:hypothetical protein [Bacillus paralicheniformis]UZN53064.1 hypothetical protein OPU65_13760 [Bacillus paralicheniformis]